MSDFEAMYMGSFETSVEYKRLHDLADEYHQRTEAFDRQVCKFVSEATGDALPVTHAERRESDQNAKAVFAAICRANPDLDPKAIRQAISRHETGASATRFEEDFNRIMACPEHMLGGQ